MRQAVKTLQDTPRRGWLAAAIAGAAILGAATGAEAGEGHWKHGPYYVPPGHVYYYAPAPVYYRPAPVVVYRPAPVFYEPAYPVYAAPVAPSFSMGLTVPLR